MICFGNSITEGYLVPPEASWPSQIEHMAALQTINYGVSGDTTIDALRRLEGVLSEEADIAFIEFGINDFFMGISADLTLKNLEKITRAFWKKGIEVIIAGFSLQGLGTQKWEEAYAQLSNKLHVPFYENIFKGLEDCNKCFLPDGLHPNEKGYKIIAENIHIFLKGKPDEELVMVVDEHNRPVGAVARHVMRKERLIHRATYILVFNSKGEIFVHKRTATKDVYPSHYDIAAGGVVLAGEEWLEAAQRELAEELGVNNVPLHFQFEFYLENTNNRVWGRVYTCQYEGPFTFQAEEVEEGFFMPIKEVFKMAQTKPFCPDGIYILKKLYK